MSTGSDDRHNPWTFEGAAYAQLVHSVRHSTATERIKALEEMLALAESSGALARTRAREAAYWQQLWSSTDSIR